MKTEKNISYAEGTKDLVPYFIEDIEREIELSKKNHKTTDIRW